MKFLHVIFLGVHNDEDKFLEFTVEFDPNQLVAIDKRGVGALFEIYNIDGAEIETKVSTSLIGDGEQSDNSSVSDSSMSSDDEGYL
jgi:hypothetical protein